MSAYVLEQQNINLLTQATNAALELNQKYPGSYYLHPDTQKILGKYTGDLHNLYRALYIANIKAVNGRYKEDTKTLPKYKKIRSWDTERLNPAELKKAAGMFGCYLYQCSEDPVYGSSIYHAFQDIRNLVCMLLISMTTDWDGGDR